MGVSLISPGSRWVFICLDVSLDVFNVFLDLFWMSFFDFVCFPLCVFLLISLEFCLDEFWMCFGCVSDSFRMIFRVLPSFR